MKIESSTFTSRCAGADKEKYYGSGRLNQPGFALVATVSMMVLLTLLALAMLSLSTLEQRSSSGSDDAMRTARANARMALMIALGELQRAAGLDQRVTATASILGDSVNNPYAGGTTAQDGKKHWVGVWDTGGYSPASADTKTFVRWLVSSPDPTTVEALAEVGTSPTVSEPSLPDDDVVIFQGVDSGGNLETNENGTYGTNSVIVPKVEVATGTSDKSYYAYWVEDQGVKADLAWNETSPKPDPSDYTGGVTNPEYIEDYARWQAARLSYAPGPDHGVFDGPFASGVTYPLEEGGTNTWIEDLEKAFSPADMGLVMGDTNNHSDWLKKHRHDMTVATRGVLADVKKGGLRRDLSLAFEMDGTAESEGATLFNQQTEEFVGNSDQQSSPYNMPGMELKARHLFRDWGPDSGAGTPSAGDFFSDDITQPLTTVRGPSWWLLRDYANLYKRLKTSGSTHALSARAYYPNRTTPVDPTKTLIYPSNSTFAEDLVDIHADNQWNDWKYGPIKVSPTNRETNNAASNYVYRPARASYAPVLLGVNAIYSLVYTGNQLKMTVDPFFILWNPYNTQITAEKFALTLEYGLAGGVRFRHTDTSGVQKLYGQPSGWGGGNGSDTYFVDFAKRKSGVNGHVSYLANGLTMGPGEVMIYSPPNEADRSGDANVLNDELFPGMNYDTSTSGIFFNEFPEYNASRQFLGWKTVSNLDPNGTIEVLFNIASQGGAAIVNIIETNIPPAGTLPNQLTTEESFGDNVAGQEYRLNLGGGEHSTNIDAGRRGFSLNYNVSELSATKVSFGLLSMLTIPTDYGEADTKMESFSQLNATPTLRTQYERFSRAPLNIVVKTVPANGINNLMNEVGIDIDAFGSGDNGFYGKSYSLAEGDTTFPLIDIPKAPLHSLVQLSGANIGTRLFEPTHPIGNSWKPPYIPWQSIYHNSANYVLGWYELTMNDVSWQVNDVLFDRYFLSGLAPEFAIGTGGYGATGSLSATLSNFYGTNYKAAKANPVLQPYIPEGETASDVITALTPVDAATSGAYKKIGAYSLIKGAFNVNSTSVSAWSAFLQGNKALAIESIQGTTDSGTDTPFPLSSSTSDTTSNNGWEKFSRLTDDQIWDDNSTPNDLTDDTGLAVEIVNQVKARGPFMSLSDFVNRRIGNDSRSYQGAIQEAIEQAGTNGNQTSGIRSNTSDSIPNYANYASLFPYAIPPYVGARNNATGVPMEINQANILLPMAAKLSARTDTFRIRGYGEVRDADDNIIAQATCEAVVQRLPEYMDAETDPGNNEPWDDDSETPTLNTINQTYGRKFKIMNFRWLDQKEV